MKVGNSPVLVVINLDYLKGYDSGYPPTGHNQTTGPNTATDGRDFHIHISLPNNTMDWEDLFSDSGSNETIEAKDPNEAHVEPTSGMYMRTEKVFRKCWNFPIFVPEFLWGEVIK